MFRIEFFVDDKKLGEALRGIAGVALGDPRVQPVVNAKEEKGQVIANGSGDIGDLFLKYVKTHRLSEIDPRDMKRFIKSIGRSESSANYFTHRLKDLGVLRKVSGTGPHTKYAAVAR